MTEYSWVIYTILKLHC